MHDANLQLENDVTHGGDPGSPSTDAPAGLAVELSAEFRRLSVRLGLAKGESSVRIDDRYRVEQTLGQGAMGVVLCAWDERLGRRVAVKLVRPRSSGDVAVLQARLEREAQMLARVDHRNVISVYDVGSHEGRVYLAMQYVAGSTVRVWQRAQRRRPSEILAIYLQAAHGLAAAHAGGIVHSDFKPDNMIVGDDGIVRVLDFGIASGLQTPETEATLDGEAASSYAAGSALDTEDPALARLTRAGAIMGTLAYMAPEQLNANRGDVQSDQFSFCVALWEALANVRPFVSENSPASPLEQHRAIEQQRLDARALPRWIRPILSKGLRLDPSDRFASMAELIAALERRGKFRRPLVLAGIVTLGLAPAVLSGWLLASSKTAPLDQPATTSALFRGTEAGDDASKPAAEVRPLPPQEIRYTPEAQESWLDVAQRFDVSIEALKASNPSLGAELGPRDELVVWIQPKPLTRHHGVKIPEFDHAAVSFGTPHEGWIENAIQFPANELYTRRNPSVMWCTGYTAEHLFEAIASFRSVYEFEGELVVGDMSRRDGGVVHPHKSHQNGRDVDIWLPMLAGVYKHEYIAQGRKPLAGEIDWYASYGLIESLHATGAVEFIGLDWELQQKLYEAGKLMGATDEALESLISWPRPSTSHDALVQHSASDRANIHVRFKCGPNDCNESSD